MPDSLATLYIEVCLKDSVGPLLQPDDVGKEVQQWLIHKFKSIKLHDSIIDYGDLSCAQVIESIRVADVGTKLKSDYYAVDEVNLDVHTYELLDDSSSNLDGIGGGSDEDALAQLRITRLPNRALEGTWESLIYDDDDSHILLRSVIRMVAFTRRQGLDMQKFSCNRLVLLHGPPGSGKSTMCRALAHKLSIRMSKVFIRGKLVEINANDLLSKFFGESGKLVNQVFHAIHLLTEDETTFVTVMIDEVETLAGSREKAAFGRECADAMRATNELLKALDQLHSRKNVLVVCTSNMLSAIDSAFVDRVYLQLFVPNPQPKASYEILRSCLNELIRNGLIQQEEEPISLIGMSETQFGIVSGAAPAQPACAVSSYNGELIPSFIERNVYLGKCPNHPATKLWDIAQNSEGLSGRELRRLPLLAYATEVDGEQCTIEQALDALEYTVREARLRLYSLRHEDTSQIERSLNEAGKDLHSKWTSPLKRNPRCAPKGDAPLGHSMVAGYELSIPLEDGIAPQSTPPEGDEVDESNN